MALGSVGWVWFGYVFLNATFPDVRIAGRVVSQAVVVATGVSCEGRREILGMDVGDTESTDLRTTFLRSLRDRGLKVATATDPFGVVLVTSDAHGGIKNAVKAILPGTSWQRCRVHFAGNVTRKLGVRASKPVNALISAVFAQTSPESLAGPFPQIATMMDAAEADLTAFTGFP